MPKVLTEAQVRAFEDHGFLSPIRAFSPERARGYRARLEALEARLPNDMKKADGRTLSGWHQDSAYGSPVPVILGALALSDRGAGQGCLRGIPGSHKRGALRHVEVFGEDGKPVRGTVGELVITKSWPGMTQGFWRDPDRYNETYWSRWPGVWVHGDWATIDADGFWFIQGRSDDTLKIAGKRLGPAEVESVLVGHPAVAESGVIGVPHEVKGEAIVCFVVLRPGHPPSEPLRRELAERVANQMGKALKPDKVLFTRDLPKTRSAKIMRRVIRAMYLGKPAGDVSSLENPDAVKAVGEAE